MSNSDKSYLDLHGGSVTGNEKGTLKDTGSHVYLHCDPTMSHLSEVSYGCGGWEARSFGTEIVWNSCNRCETDNDHNIVVRA